MVSFNNYQKDIARAYRTSSQNIAVLASAGSGKTTMLVGLSHLIKRPHSFAFLAFTQATAEVLRKRMPHLGNAIMTTYSLGYRNVSRYLEASLDVVQYKSENNYDLLVNSLGYLSAAGEPLDLDSYELKRNVCRLQRLSLLDCRFSQPDIREFAEKLNQGWLYDSYKLDWMAKLAFNITKLGHKQLLEDAQIDYQEMIAWPAMWDDLEPIGFDEIFVDEFQDLSKAQQTLVHKSLRQGGQIVMVGDRSQAIYGFAGAEADSATSMVQLFNAKCMPMPICYRCAKAIIEHAQELDPVIQAYPGAPQGEVTEASPATALEYLLDCQIETLVVARTNVLLIKLALNMLRLDKQFSFQRDVLEERLLNLIAKATSAQPKINVEAFPSWLEMQREYASGKKANLILDLLDCLEVFYKHAKPSSWAALRRSIKSFFKHASKQSNLTLSTIHAAKGSEAHTVVYWGTNYVPHRLSKTTEELQQEANLEYIARTRAIQRLIRVDLG